jgi:hypothetical protein
MMCKHNRESFKDSRHFFTHHLTCIVLSTGEGQDEVGVRGCAMYTNQIRNACLHASCQILKLVRHDQKM